MCSWVCVQVVAKMRQLRKLDLAHRIEPLANELLHMLGDEAGSGMMHGMWDGDEAVDDASGIIDCLITIPHANTLQDGNEFGVATSVAALLPHFFLCHVILRQAHPCHHCTIVGQTHTYRRETACTLTSWVHEARNAHRHSNAGSFMRSSNFLSALSQAWRGSRRRGALNHGIVVTWRSTSHNTLS